MLGVRVVLFGLSVNIVSPVVWFFRVRISRRSPGRGSSCLSLPRKCCHTAHARGLAPFHTQESLPHPQAPCGNPPPSRGASVGGRPVLLSGCVSAQQTLGDVLLWLPGFHRPLPITEESTGHRELASPAPAHSACGQPSPGSPLCLTAGPSRLGTGAFAKQSFLLFRGGSESPEPAQVWPPPPPISSASSSVIRSPLLPHSGT